MLGFDDLDWAVQGHDDGLQVLRYNQTTAYTSHMDYMADHSNTELFVSLGFILSFLTGFSFGALMSIIAHGIK